MVEKQKQQEIAAGKSFFFIMDVWHFKNHYWLVNMLLLFVVCVCLAFFFFFNHFWLRWVFVAARRLSLFAVLRLPIVVASLSVTEHMLQVHSLY